MASHDLGIDRIGGFKVIRRLATGGTSDVLLARAEGPHGFERNVVLKILLPYYRDDKQFARMFAREAAAYARLSHPSIVKLFHFFSADGQLVMVLEYVDGLPLNKLRAMLRARSEPLDDRVAIFIGSRIFAALAAAHTAADPATGGTAPVIHRDVNPSNVLIPWDGHVKLADFGIAKVTGIQGDTQAGFIKGTYGYMAPEQVRGEDVTPRADVYAASLLLWELLSRRKAIQRGQLPEVEVLRAMAEPHIVSLDVLRPDLDPAVRAVIRRGLEPSAEARTIGADEVLAVLRVAANGEEARKRLVDVLGRVRATRDSLQYPPPSSSYADDTIVDRKTAPASHRPPPAGSSPSYVVGAVIAASRASDPGAAPPSIPPASSTLPSSTASSAASPISTTRSGAPGSVAPPRAAIPPPEVEALARAVVEVAPGPGAPARPAIAKAAVVAAPKKSDAPAAPAKKSDAPTAPPKKSEPPSMSKSDPLGVKVTSSPPEGPDAPTVRPPPRGVPSDMAPTPPPPARETPSDTAPTRVPPGPQVPHVRIEPLPVPVVTLPFGRAPGAQDAQDVRARTMAGGFSAETAAAMRTLEAATVKAAAGAGEVPEAPAAGDPRDEETQVRSPSPPDPTNATYANEPATMPGTAAPANGAGPSDPPAPLFLPADPEMVLAMMNGGGGGMTPFSDAPPPMPGAPRLPSSPSQPPRAPSSTSPESQATSSRGRVWIFAVLAALAVGGVSFAIARSTRASRSAASGAATAPPSAGSTASARPPRGADPGTARASASTASNGVAAAVPSSRPGAPAPAAESPAPPASSAIAASPGSSSPASAPAASGAAALVARGPAVPPLPPVAAPPAPPVASPPPASAAASPPSAGSVAATKTLLHTDKASRDHRIFVDGHVVGSTPNSVTIPCGAHTVKIGSGGHPHTLDLPCGGETSLDR